MSNPDALVGAAYPEPLPADVEELVGDEVEYDLSYDEEES